MSEREILELFKTQNEIHQNLQDQIKLVSQSVQRLGLSCGYSLVCPPGTPLLPSGAGHWKETGQAERNRPPTQPRFTEADLTFGDKMEMRLDRLEACYQANVKASPWRFMMGSWAEKMECGTTRCMVGNYANQNPSCGLILFWPDDGEPDAELIDAATLVKGFRAVEDHFGLTSSEAEYLFAEAGADNDDHYFVRLSRLRAFITDHTPPTPLPAPIDFIHPLATNPALVPDEMQRV